MIAPWNRGTRPNSASLQRDSFLHRAHLIGRLLITTCNQGSGAPFIDRGFTRCADGRTARSKVILLTPWRRDAHGTRAEQRALVLGLVDRCD